MEGPFIVVVVLLLLVLITLLKGIRLVPQGSKWVVQRLGKYHTSLKPGLNIIVPYIDNVAFKVYHQGYRVGYSVPGSHHLWITL